MNRRIATLRSLAAPAGSRSAAVHSPALDSPETLAATLHQLARIIQQTSDAPLPSGTSVDWPLPEALSAAARLDGDESGAFRGHGRVLGPMYDADGLHEAALADEGAGAPRRYNLRSQRGTGTPGKTSRAASASSVAVRRGSVAATEAQEVEGVEAEAEAEAEAAETNTEEADRKWADNEDDRDDRDDREDGDNGDGTTARKTGTVMRDETQSGRSRSSLVDPTRRSYTANHQDGTRKIQVHLRRSRGSVTLVIPKSPAADLQTPAAEARDTARLPAISFQLSPEFHLPEQEADGEKEKEAEIDQPAADSPEPLLDSPSRAHALDFLDSGFYEDDGQDDQDDRDSFYDSLHLWSDTSDDAGSQQYVESADAVDSHATHAYNGHPQPPVGTRLEQVLVYLRSQDPATDRHWHVRAAAIEAYLDFLQGVPEPASASTSTSPEAAQVADQQARLDAALVRIETDEQFARAAMEGRPADADSIAYYNAVNATQPPPILGARSLAILAEARRQLAAHHAFFGSPQARAGASAVSSAGGADFLSTLLATTGRSFAARMAMNARAEAHVQFDENYFSGQAERHKQHSKDDRTYLFDSEHALLEGTPLARLETHPFTAQMARFRRFRQHYMDEARILAEQTHGGTDDWATLPPSNGVYSLGYSKVLSDDTSSATGLCPRLVPRQPLPPHMERDRQLLQLLRGLTRLLVRRLDTAPRPLLAEVAKYAEQGLSGLAAPASGLVLRDAFDLDGDGPRRTVRPLAEPEARWLQFLLSDSTNEQLAAPLPRGPFTGEDPSIADPTDPAAAQSKADEEGSCALYHAFAHRFQALLDADAMNPEGLFATADRVVPVVDVVDAINRQPGSKFSVYDGLHFLSRLSRAGRCRFQHFPASKDHGVVQRPRLTMHPEHRIHEPSTRAPPVVSDAELRADDAIGAPRRATDVDATWDDTMARARQTVPDPVHRFFCCLGFRLGHTLRALETGARAQWQAYLDAQDTQPAGETMRRSLRVWAQTYEQLVRDSGALDEAAAGGIPTSFKDVIRLADEKLYNTLNDSGDMHPGSRRRKRRRRSKVGTDPFTEEAARAYVHRQLISEAARGHEAPINAVTNPVARGVWDWAQPEIVGEAPPHFFHMHRWPLHLQTKAMASHVREGARIAMDPEILWDPASEDPTPAEYLWSVSTEDRRYGFRRIETAETQYMRGDTALQQQAVVRDITRRVAAAIGVGVDELSEGGEGGGTSKTTQGIAGWLVSKLGKRKRDDEDEGVNVIDFAVTELPKVKDVPRSLDWTEMAQRGFDDGEDEDEDEDEGDEDEDEDEDEGDEGDDRTGLKTAEAWTDEDDRALIREIHAAR